jgi:hypothetical protein
MNKYLRYLLYVLRHKWFVFVILVTSKVTKITWRTIWRGIMHDMSKFRLDEFIPYARYFYGNYPTSEQIKSAGFPESYRLTALTKERIKIDFDLAWLKHIHRNPHHWQYWLLREDNGNTKILPMHYGYLKEMLADWRGAGRAITGNDDVKSWYDTNKNKIVLDDMSRKWIEEQI